MINDGNCQKCGLYAGDCICPDGVASGSLERVVSCVHSAISYSKVEVRGAWGMQGPQNVGTPGGAPAWVADALKSENILAVAYVTENGGAIYQRLSS